MASNRSATAGLLAGLAVTLTGLAVYALYTARQIQGLRRLQTEIIERNRKDSLQLLRIQNDLNSLALAMRDMLDANEPYPLTAWSSQYDRIREDLNDATKLEETVSPGSRTTEQQQYLAASFSQFWDALDRMFALARNGKEEEARNLIRISLQARQAGLSVAVARLLVQNNESEEQAVSRIQEIYARVERNLYLFLAAMAAIILLTSLYLIHYNRRLFARLAAVSEQRSELAQKLISTQEETFRHISRELHDEFGQILTAVGAMLQRAERQAPDSTFRSELREVREIAQSSLETVRSLSQVLHPVILDEAGLESAIDWYLPVFEKQTRVAVRYEKTGGGQPVNGRTAAHLYRVLQEALNNVARHSKASEAWVRLRFSPEQVVLEVEDHGLGFEPSAPKRGIGLVAMRERAELVNGQIEFLQVQGGGTLVRLTARPEASG